jgi:hypothetical protein
MRLELKIGKTGRAFMQFVTALFFAYLGLIFAYRINYNNPLTFRPYAVQFLFLVIVARILVNIIAEFARRIGVRV